MTWDTDLEIDLWRDICQDSLYWFIRVAYGMDFQPPRASKWFTPRIHKPICDWFTKHAKEWLDKRNGLNLMLVVPRYFGKTTIITICGQAWLHCNDTELSTYSGSESIGQTQEMFTEPMKKILDGSDPYGWFTYLWGNWYAKDREWRREYSTHAARRGVGRKEPSLGTWGVEKGITGRHPDAGFLDDPTSYEVMASHSEWFRIVNDHVAGLMPIFTDTALMCWQGTRYGDGDHIGTELRKEGILSLTGMRVPDATTERGQAAVLMSPDGKWHVYFLQARDIDNSTDEFPTGTPIYPERCSDKFLREFERKNNLRYWAQMMNDPAGSEYNPLSREQVNECWVNMKNVPKNLRMFMHCDTAFKSQEKQSRGDSSVIIVAGQSMDESGTVYIFESWGSETVTLDEYLTQLVRMYQKYQGMGRRIRGITDEREMGGHVGSWEANIRNAFHGKNIALPMFYAFPRQGKKKIGRIIEAAGYWSSGYVYLVQDGPGLEHLVDEMVRIGNSAHDDYSDAASDIFHSDIYRAQKMSDHNPRRVTNHLLFVGDDELKKGNDPFTPDSWYDHIPGGTSEYEPV
jgi:hypothetical protein